MFTRPLKFLRALTLVILGGLSTSCMLLDEAGLESNASENGTGFVRFELELEQTQEALRKAASADTAFSLDSLIIILTAPGAVTQTHRIALTGRADLGNIAVPPQTYTLLGLRPWKAKFISIDTSTSPLRRDTVHLDSLEFSVVLNDTVPLAKTVSPVYSILRVRFLSTNQDSIVSPVRFVRLRVNGVMRDSALIGGSNASLNWLQAMSGSTIHAAGDSGRILRSTNDGGEWMEQRVTSNPLVGGHFLDANTGFVLSNVGTMYRTGDGGGAWQERATLDLTNGVRDTASAIYFPHADYGFVIGRNGAIWKTGDGWQQWKLVSNTSYHLNGMHFPTATTGFVVGENETILKTSNAGAAGGLAPQNGGIIWAPVAGGWFNQTSNSTNRIMALQFNNNMQGWALGHGYAYKTVDGGATWLDRSSGISSANVNAISMLSFTLGFAAGQNGALLKSDNNEWSWQQMANANNTINNRHLNDIRMANADTGYAVGASGAIVRTVNGTATASAMLWTSQLGWFPQGNGSTGNVSSWLDLYSIRFNMNGTNRDTGWVTGSNGTIYKTVDRGYNWTQQTSNTSSTLYDIAVLNGKKAVAVGSGGVIRRTNDGGANWSTITSGVSSDINAVAFTSQRIGWLVGASNVIRSTNDTGKVWTSRNVAGTYYGVTAGPNRVWVVGASGAVRRSSSLANNTTFTTVGNTGLTSYQLNAVDFVSDPIGWVVGSSGRIFKTTNGNASTASNVTWTQQAVGLTNANLTHVHFVNANIGYVSGAGGVLLKTTNGGTNWVIQNTGTPTSNLNDVFAIDSETVYASGLSARVLKTTNGGATDTTTFRSVEPATSRIVYVAGSGGRILKSTNAGENWVQQSSTTSHELNAISFRSATSGIAVGKNGTILQTTDGGGLWTPRTSGTTQELTSVKFVSNDTGYAVGANGLVVKTVNGGSAWYVQETPTTQRLNRVHGFSRDMVFAVGDSGRILKAVNEGDNWTGGGVKRSLKGVYFPTVNTGYIVGGDGTILKTTNGGDVWKKQTSNVSTTLYGVHFTDSLTGWVSGANGVVLKTSNGGTNWVPQNSGQPSITLRWANFRNSNRGFLIGGSQSLVSTANGGGLWSSSFVGVVGLRTFDQLLTYKYLKPNQSHTVLYQAIDQVSPLRGYQGSRTVIVGAGADSTIVQPLTKCGYGGLTPACTP